MNKILEKILLTLVIISIIVSVYEINYYKLPETVEVQAKITHVVSQYGTSGLLNSDKFYITYSFQYGNKNYSITKCQTTLNNRRQNDLEIIKIFPDNPTEIYENMQSDWESAVIFLIFSIATAIILIFFVICDIKNK